MSGVGCCQCFHISLLDFLIPLLSFFHYGKALTDGRRYVKFICLTHSCPCRGLFSM